LLKSDSGARFRGEFDTALRWVRVRAAALVVLDRGKRC
jgi:hypothetical protein